MSNQQNEILPQLYYTFILPVYNESDRVSRIINYYKQYGKIIVVDNYSTDDTADKVKKLGCEIVQIRNSGTIQTKEIMNEILRISPTKYVALLSCSEFIPPHTLRVFEEVAKSNSHNLVRNVLISFTCGENIQIWDGILNKIDRTTERFFNKEELDYESIFIHAPFKTTNQSDVLTLPNDAKYNIIHLRDSDLSSLMQKHISYAAAEAKQMEECGIKLSLYAVTKRILADFIRYLKLPSSAKGFIAKRELWARIVLNVSIYIFYRETMEGKGIEYSRNKSNELWNRLANSRHIAKS